MQELQELVVLILPKLLMMAAAAAVGLMLRTELVLGAEEVVV